MLKKYQLIWKIKKRGIKCGVKFLALLPLFSLIVMGTGSALAAGTKTLTVSASIINVCRFNSSTATMNFGAINPAGTTNITRTTNIRFRCNGNASAATFAFTSNDGLYETGPGANRMRNATVTTEYLPYTLALSPQSGIIPSVVNQPQTLSITGTVTSTNYRSAYVGNYRDTVVISLNP